ncbi:hypothetical protein [Mucilaginibacter lacusdianchii]|uniref:hypothetical protein n=1 Tax=Mucilaginibacter lacusdianchii TaxID=2684211 RepID=UPI00131DEDB5|nr:hypothetical protein [Mucilaginibacter sp. JXJ CY 39]
MADAKHQNFYIYSANILNKRRSKILASLVLLLIFITGQAIVFGHNHNAESARSTYAVNKHKSATPDTKCQICSQSGQVQLFLQTQQVFFLSNNSLHQFATYITVYQSIALLLISNRGPPTIG